MVWDSGNASDRCGRPVRAGRASFIMRSFFSTHFVPKTLFTFVQHILKYVKHKLIFLLFDGYSEGVDPSKKMHIECLYL